MHNFELPSLEEVLQNAALDERSHLGRVVISDAQRMTNAPVAELESRSPSGKFVAAIQDAIRTRGGAIIAEFKRASPSLGAFAEDRNLDTQLQAYASGGAACVSVLAEPALFQGSVEDVREAAAYGMPRLYKGFVLCQAHLREAQICNAEAVLLIARVLKQFTPVFAQAARYAGLEPLIELHDLSEIEYARGADAELIGINARDLASFSIGSPDASPLRDAFPDAILIRESGLASPDDIREAFAQGFDAVLIGEALMRSEDPKAFLKAAYA